MGTRFYSAEEESYIRQEYDGTTENITRILKELGRGERHNVTRVAIAGGYKPKKKRKAWTEEENALLRSLWGTVTGDEICARLGRSYQSINLQRKRLGFSTRDDEGYRIIDLERLFKIDHRQWHDFVDRGWLKTYKLYGKEGEIATCVTVDALQTLLREHPEIVDVSKVGRVARAAFELWSLPTAPKWKHVSCMSNSWEDGQRLTPNGFQVHHGAPVMVMREHKFSMASCQSIGGVSFWTETYNQSPCCPRCGCKVSRYSSDAMFSDDKPDDDEAMNAVAGKLGLVFDGAGFVDASGHPVGAGDLLRYVFSTKRNPGKAVRVFSELLDKGLTVAQERAVDEEEIRPHLMRYRPTPKQQEIIDEWLTRGAYSPLLRPGSGKTVIAATVMTRVVGRHVLFVPTKTIAEHWIKHLNDNAHAVKVVRLHKPERTEITVYELAGGEARCVIEIWSYMTRHDFSDREYGVAVFDETHFLPSNNAHRLSLIKCKYRMGLSATPFREDGREALIEHMAGKALHDDWKGKSAAGLEIPRFPIKVMIVKDVEAKFAAVKELIRRAGRCILFAEALADGRRIETENGVPFVFSGTENRLEVIRNNRVIAISRCGDAGIDIPDLETVIEFSFLGKSRAQSMQRAGRLMHSEKARQHCVLVTAKEAQQYMQRFTVLEQRGFPLQISLYKPGVKRKQKVVAPSALKAMPIANWWSTLGEYGRSWKVWQAQEASKRRQTVLASA